MSEIIFATPDTVQQPTGGLILIEREEQDHVLGATGYTGYDFDILVTDAHWSPFAPVAELQTTKYGDLFGCVSFSKNNAKEFIHKKRYLEEINCSDVFLTVGSGTIRNQGNSKKAVAEWDRLNGFVLEAQYPLLPDMNLDQVYQPIPKNLLIDGIKSLEIFESLYKWLTDNKPSTILTGMTFSPVQVDIEGRYVFNSKGYVMNTGVGYTHEVLIFDFEPKECWYVFDSERLQYLKFDWNYSFGSPMIHAWKKKVMKNLYRKLGQKAIGLYVPDVGGLYLYRDGIDNTGVTVAGGSVFKALGYTYDLAQKVDEWPYPVKGEFGIDAGGIGNLTQFDV